MENAIVSQDKHKPVFDEQTLGKLLEAAFVLQEHGHELRKLDSGAVPRRDPIRTSQAPASKTPAPQLPSPELAAIPPVETQDYSSTLGRIVETQHEIEIRQLDADAALSLVAEQLIEICSAAGAAIAVVKGNAVRYRAIAGIRALPQGSEVPLEKALCAPCLRTGDVFSCPDVNPQFRNDLGECRRRGIGSLIVVPVFRDSEVAGALELYYSDPRAFTDQDINTCQLMAGLVTEALAHEEGPSKAAQTRESAPLFKPQEKTGPSRQISSEQRLTPPPVSALCQKCGHRLVGDEQFCGECGAARKTASAPSMDRKLDPAWLDDISTKNALTRVPQDEFSLGRQADAGPPNSPGADNSNDSFSEVLDRAALRLNRSSETVTSEPSVALQKAADVTEYPEHPADPDLGKIAPDHQTMPPADWSSALSARAFLEEIASGNRKRTLIQFWNARRGDIYLGIAIILVICVIRWGIWSSHPVKATTSPAQAMATHKPPAAPQLSAVDRMLISLGLAEAPEPPADKGNPSAQVWVDLRTGLYYCPAADLYGKTTKGKYTSQRDAQLDQFQPAYRQSCE